MPKRSMHMANSFDPSGSSQLDRVDADLLRRREQVLGSAYRLFYQHPVHIVRGEGTLLYDADGNDYLDAYNNVPVVGHSNPHVREAVARQLGTLNTHTRYLTDDVVAYAERLTGLFPPGLDQVVFACTGSEAVDLALRIATYATGADGIIAMAHAYHGTTRATAEISPSLGPNNEIPDHVVLVDAPDSVRDSAATAADDFETRIRSAVAELRARGHRPAALIIDSILSSDGAQVPPTGYLHRAIRVIHDAGGLYIADEVQPGFGRTGTWWGLQHYGITPDLVALGKPMGNGIPISAVVGHKPLFDSFGADVRYFNTFGGNPVSIGAADAVLDELEEQDLLHSAELVGRRLRQELSAITREDDRVAEVRGAGLFLAVEFVHNRASNDPDSEFAATVVNRMRAQRVLVSASGTHDNVLKIRPPLVFNESHIDRFVTALQLAMNQ